MCLFVLLGVSAITCSHLERGICVFSLESLRYFVSKCGSFTGVFSGDCVHLHVNQCVCVCVCMYVCACVSVCVFV